MDNNDPVTGPAVRRIDDALRQRKARGAFFTPPEIVRFIVDWAVRAPGDRVLEPSAGEAAFLVAAAQRLGQLDPGQSRGPAVHGVEIHPASAALARARVAGVGGTPRIKVADFFSLEPKASYSVVVGNPPYIRYQDFRGAARMQSRTAALKGGVALSALASSWAAFTVHSALFLRTGGRMGLVLPGELLSVNYAGAVRQFLFDRFKSVDLVLFDEQVFPEAEADVVLLLAEGFNEGPSSHATIHRARNANDLRSTLAKSRWVPGDPSGKWIDGIVGSGPVDLIGRLATDGHFSALDQWGDTTLGIVTGNNGYFALSAARVRELGLASADLLRLSPPGSSHLRGLVLSNATLKRLERNGKAVYLFRPASELSPAAERYVRHGQSQGVDSAYKCRIRKPWYRVPLLKPADLLLTCMNADTPRLVANEARVHHLNSVHGVYLRDALSDIGTELLPIAALNSVTLLHAEMVGRSYGGGILKIEPREADRWLVPSDRVITRHSVALRAIRRRVATLLRHGRLMDAVEVVDQALDLDRYLGSVDALISVRAARVALASRRAIRSRSGR